MTPVECDTEILALMREGATLARRLLRGEANLQADLDVIRDCIAYANRAWNAERWPRYFQPYGGAVHSRPLCGGLTRPAPLMAKLSGVSDPQVVARYGKRCTRC